MKQPVLFPFLNPFFFTKANSMRPVLFLATKQPVLFGGGSFLGLYFVNFWAIKQPVHLFFSMCVCVCVCVCVDLWVGGWEALPHGNKGLGFRV